MYVELLTYRVYRVPPQNQQSVALLILNLGTFFIEVTPILVLHI